MKPVVISALVAVMAAPLSALALTFTAGHYYSTSESAINEYNAQGTLLSSIAYGSSGDLRGLTFGPDGYLYVVRAGDPFATSASVDVLRSDGGMVRTYGFTGLVWGNISYGKISFDVNGSSFYVGASNGLYKFDAAGNSGFLFKNVDAFDVKPLPNSDILVASSYALNRYDSAGTQLATISALTDPMGLTGDPSPRLVDVRGVEFDPASNKTFVTMLGYSGAVNMSFKVLALKGGTNEIEGLENFWYGDDMFVTDTGRLLIGSRTQTPGMFTPQLSLLGQFNGPEARFVTSLPVPEPTSQLLLILGLGFGAIMTRRRPR